MDTLGRGTECRCHGSVAATMRQQALSVPRGTPATWRRAGSTRMPAQEDVLVRDSSTCLLDVAEGTLEGRASSDAITRSVAAEPVAIADVIPLWRGERARRRLASNTCLERDLVPTPSRQVLRGSVAYGRHEGGRRFGEYLRCHCSWMGSNLLWELRFPATEARVGQCRAESKRGSCADTVRRLDLPWYRLYAVCPPSRQVLPQLQDASSSTRGARSGLLPL